MLRLFQFLAALFTRFPIVRVRVARFVPSRWRPPIELEAFLQSHGKLPAHAWSLAKVLRKAGAKRPYSEARDTTARLWWKGLL